MTVSAPHMTFGGHQQAPCGGVTLSAGRLRPPVRRWPSALPVVPVGGANASSSSPVSMARALALPGLAKVGATPSVRLLAGFRRLRAGQRRH